jgi:hypothetical protein
VDTTYFHYDKSLKILCLLSGRYGTKWGVFSWYLEEKGSNMPKDFALLPLLGKDAMAKFKKWGILTSLSANFKLGNNIRVNSGQVQQLSVADMLKGSKQKLNAGTVEVKFKNSRRKGGLILEAGRKITEMLKNISQLVNGAEIESLKVSGSVNAETKDIIIDLLKQRYKLNIKLEGSDRVLDFDECKKMVNKAIDENRKELGELIE